MFHDRQHFFVLVEVWNYLNTYWQAFRIDGIFLDKTSPHVIVVVLVGLFIILDRCDWDCTRGVAEHAPWVKIVEKVSKVVGEWVEKGDGREGWGNQYINFRIDPFLWKFSTELLSAAIELLQLIVIHDVCIFKTGSQSTQPRYFKETL